MYRLFPKQDQEKIIMKYLVTTLFATALMSGAGFTSLAMASENGKKCEYHKGGSDHHKGGHHDGKQCEHHKGGQQSGKQCDHHKGGQHGKAWMKGLSDDQKKKLDALHVDYKKQKLALRKKIKDAKIALAKETIKDTPDTSVIYVKINDVVKHKATKMRLKAAHHIKVRKLLTKEQRVKFDEYVLKSASRGKHYKGHH